MHAIVELPGYATLDDQIFASLHGRQQESRSKRTSVVVNVICLCAVAKAEIDPVPADLAYSALGRQDRRLGRTVKLCIPDNHHEILEFPGSRWAFNHVGQGAPLAALTRPRPSEGKWGRFARPVSG